MSGFSPSFLLGSVADVEKSTSKNYVKAISGASFQTTGLGKVAEFKKAVTCLISPEPSAEKDAKQVLGSCLLN